LTEGSTLDDQGIWFLGNDDAMVITVLNVGITSIPETAIGKPTYTNAGIFVPHNLTLHPKIFTINGSSISTTPSPSVPAQTVGDTNSALIGTLQTVHASNPTFASARPLQAGIAGGFAYGVVSLLVAAEQADFGKFMITSYQPSEAYDFRKDFVVKEMQIELQK
jgi:hypothetical protein